MGSNHVPSVLRGDGCEMGRERGLALCGSRNQLSELGRRGEFLLCDALELCTSHGDSRRHALALRDAGQVHDVAHCGLIHGLACA